MSTPKKTTPKAAKPQPETKTEPRPERPVSALNDFQKNLAEITGDLIMHGGEPSQVDMFLRAVIAHQWTRCQTLGGTPPGERYVEDRVPAWRESLAAGWLPRPELPKVTAAEGSWVESMRQNNKARLAYELEHFLDMASPEEVFFLFEVLERFRQHSDMTSEEVRFRQDVLLLDCIAASIGDAHTYIRVPEELAEVVRRQVAVLVEASEKKVA